VRRQQGQQQQQQQQQQQAHHNTSSAASTSRRLPSMLIICYTPPRTSVQVVTQLAARDTSGPDFAQLSCEHGDGFRMCSVHTQVLPVDCCAASAAINRPGMLSCA
jgi:hypothetical protein